MNSEEAKKNIIELTGAINAALQQLKQFDKRLQQIEAKNSSEALGELNATLKKLENRVEEVDKRPRNDDPPQELEEPLTRPRTEAELNEVAKLPDCVKELQIFDGNREHYSSWVHSAEQIISDYSIVKGKPIYRAILRHIRYKIRGAADAALVSHNILDSDWKKIKETLSLHYADVRDIETLDQQLTQMTQGRLKISEFYAQVNRQLSLMINTISTEKYAHGETILALTETHRRRALDVFIRGLNGDLPTLLLVQKPKSLPEAYSACLTFMNVDRRNAIHRRSRSPNPYNRGFNNNFQSLAPRHYSGNNYNYNGSGQYSSQNYSGQSQDRAIPNRNYPNSGQTRNSQQSIQSWRANSSPSGVVRANPDPSSQTRQSNNPNQIRKFSNFKGGSGSGNFSGQSNKWPDKKQKMFHLVPVEEAEEEATEHRQDQNNGDQINFTVGASCPAFHI